MPDESRYDAVLAAALALIHQLETKPHMPRHEKLAKVTFAILHEIGRAEILWRAAGSSLPSASGAETACRWFVTARPSPN